MPTSSLYEIADDFLGTHLSKYRPDMLAKSGSDARKIEVDAPSFVDIPKYFIKLDITLNGSELLFAKSEFTSPGCRQLTVKFLSINFLFIS